MDGQWVTGCSSCHQTSRVEALKDTQSADIQPGKITHWPSIAGLRREGAFLSWGFYPDMWPKRFPPPSSGHHL